jgi:hypothetical protein
MTTVTLDGLPGALLRGKPIAVTRLQAQDRAIVPQIEDPSDAA